MRAQGEDLIVQHHFTIDDTPPVTTLSSSFLAPSLDASPEGTAVTSSDTPAGPEATATNSSSSSASDAISFAFTAKDLSAVKFECLITHSEPGQAAGTANVEDEATASMKSGAASNLRALYGKGLSYSGMLQSTSSSVHQNSSPSPQIDPASSSNEKVSNGQLSPPLGQWLPCVTPVTLLGVSFGDWEFLVRATDSAGNLDVAPPLYSWSTRYNPGQMYVRAVAGDYGLVNHADLKFDLSLLQQGQDTATAPIPVAGDTFTKGLEWALVSSDASPLGVLGHSSVEGFTAQLTPQETAKAQWNQVTPWVPQLQITVPQDGSYTLLLRPVPLDGLMNSSSSGGSSTEVAAKDVAGMGIVPLVVDSTPPLIKITSKPPSVQGNPSVTVKFESVPADDVVSYSCRWLFSNVSAPTGQEPKPGFEECKSAGQQLGLASVATQDVQNGFWMFQVRHLPAVFSLLFQGSVISTLEYKLKEILDSHVCDVPICNHFTVDLLQLFPLLMQLLTQKRQSSTTV